MIPEEFWAQVEKGAPDECWLWTGTLAQKGYGRFGDYAAHRVSWEIAFGPIPEGLTVVNQTGSRTLLVCHRCDTRACVNPAHLFLGTQADNQRDKVGKGRAARGDTHGRSSLPVAMGLEVRRLANEGWTQWDLAQRFGVGRGPIRRFLNPDYPLE